MEEFIKRAMEIGARGDWKEEDVTAFSEELAGLLSMQVLKVDNPEALQGQNIDSLCKELPSMDPDDPRRVDLGIATAGSRYVWSDVEGSPMRPIVRCNALWYCVAHEREICKECNQDRLVENTRTGFTLPDSMMPEYPRLLMDSSDWQLVRKVYAWWLDLQKNLYPGARVSISASLVQLPAGHVADEVNASAVPLQETLLQLFHQVQGMATTQRYFFANQAKIMLEDYDTFGKAAVLYEEGLADWFSEGSRIYEDPNFLDEFIESSARTSNLDKILSQYGVTVSQMRELLKSGNVRPFDKKLWRIRKAKASIVNTFGFFLELNTTRSFWRGIELTAGAFVLHLQKYHEPSDGDVVVTEKAKASLLQCLAHVFWSLRYAQHRMDQLRAFQYQIYQRREFPFYPFQVEALKAGVDIHLIIAKLSKVPMYNFPLVSSLLSAFEQAGQFKKQMQEVNAQLMATFDELSTRYRVLEVLLRAAGLLASEAEIKAALVSFKFEAAGQDVTSKLDHVTGLLELGGSYEAEVVVGEQVTVPMTYQQALQTSMTKRLPAPKKPSFFQRLLGTENDLRHKHAASFMQAPMLAPQAKGFTADAFNAFKARYLLLYDTSIRQQYKQDEQSLLPLDVARRFQHRNEVAKKKRSLAAKDRASADLAECRDVPQTSLMDPSLFWAVGDGRAEKYVTPVVHEKVKTRKLQEGNNTDCAISDGSSETAGSVLSTAGSTPVGMQRPLEQLKHSDLTTRDILWRKVKGTLKWSNLVQLLTRLGCWILNLDGSKRKVVDPISGRCTVLHMPHPGDECRPDQRDAYRLHIEDWLNIQYSEIGRADEVESTGESGSEENVGMCAPA